MLFRILGALLFLFGSFTILGYLLGGAHPRTGETSFATKYNDLIAGIALFIPGLYMLVKGSDKKA